MPDPITTFPPSPTVPNYGIQDVLTINSKVYILQQVTPADKEKTVEWQDQYDATIGSRQIEIATTGSLTAIGEASAQVTGQACRFPLAVGAALTFRGLKFQIKGITETGSYNGMTVWSIEVARWTNWPASASTLPDKPVSAAVALPVAPVVVT